MYFIDVFFLIICLLSSSIVNNKCLVSTHSLPDGPIPNYEYKMSGVSVGVPMGVSVGVAMGVSVGVAMALSVGVVATVTCG